MNESTELIHLLEVLTRIEGWLRFSNIPRLKELLETELDDDRKRAAYENSDGLRSVREVARTSGVPAGTLPSWWSRWFNLGIVVESPSRQGRMKKICSLRSLGIELPKMTATESTFPSSDGPI